MSKVGIVYHLEFTVYSTKCAVVIVLYLPVFRLGGGGGGGGDIQMVNSQEHHCFFAYSTAQLYIYTFRKKKKRTGQPCEHVRLHDICVHVYQTRACTRVYPMSASNLPTRMYRLLARTCI